MFAVDAGLVVNPRGLEAQMTGGVMDGIAPALTSSLHLCDGHFLVDADPRPMRQAWVEHDVAQCGYCRPGQLMTAVALVHRVAAEGRGITDADLDAIRNICRCGTYPRTRDAIGTGAQRR